MTTQKTHNDFVCVRHGKLKQSDLSAAWRHTARLQNTPNANPLLANENLVACVETNWELVPFVRSDTRLQKLFEEQYISGKVKSAVDVLGITSIRKDATLACQMILAVSPEELRDGDEAGPLNPAKVRSFSRAVVRDQREQHGNNLLAVVVHNDEANPHADSYVIPAMKRVRKKRGRPSKEMIVAAKAEVGWTLSARDMFTPKRCSQDQDRFAAACCAEGLDVRRGIKGSRTPHLNMKAHLALVHAPLPTIKPMVLLNPQEGMDGLLETKHAYYRTAQADLDDQIQQANKMLSHYYAKALERDREVTQRKGYQKTADMKARQLAHVEQELAETKSELIIANDQIALSATRARTVSLEEAVPALGLTLTSEGGEHHYSSQLGTIRLHQKGFVNETTGHKGRNAIDLSMHVLQCDFETAVRWLGTHFPDEAKETVHELARQQADATVSKAEAKGNVSFQEMARLVVRPDQAKWPEVRKAFSISTGLNESKLDELQATRLIMPTATNHLAVALYPNLPGLSSSPTGFVLLSPQKPETIIQHLGDPQAVFLLRPAKDDPYANSVITPSVPEALAYAALHHKPKGPIIGMTGNQSVGDLIAPWLEIKRRILLAAKRENLEKNWLAEATELIESVMRRQGYSAETAMDLFFSELSPLLGSWIADLKAFKNAEAYEIARRTNEEGINRTLRL